ncbi:MAG: winged helix-turn-helix transcriptional regulator [Bacteroidales bacterium]|nr:winged helix-turn-helix transcriptional regulator [Bacteroidales bacterium]MBD5376912.1 winged helix-turn-helix transcriptional regulator [Bacteroides sp.]
MARQQFDKLDLKILNMLSSNARKPFLEIARECNVSGAAIHQRIQKLIAAGIIKGFESLINPSSVGYDTCAYIGFFLNDPSRFPEIVEELHKIPEVVECHFTTGKYDIFIKVYTHSNEGLLNFIHTKLQPIGVGRTETIISFKEEFRRQVPIITEEA